MKYIRTKDTIFEVLEDYKNSWLVRAKRNNKKTYPKGKKNSFFVKQADTIEELCDEFVCQENDNFYWLASRENVSFRDLPNCYCKAIFGAIWTDKGLIYVAKMNEKGELELL